MKLHFLGTGAADWDIAKADASREFRRNSSLLIDGRLLIDPGRCLAEFESAFGYTDLYAGVTDIICTHRHGDHFSPETVEMLTRNGSVFHETEAGDTLELEHYTVRVFPANHCTAQKPVHFLIESKDDGKRLFYGTDGAWLPYETYRGLMAAEHVDLMIFDCTIGDIHGDYRIFEHNNCAMIGEMRATFLKLCPRFMATHLARTLHPAHDDAAQVLAGYGFETAYDNLITEV